MRLHYPRGQPPEGEDVLWRCEAKRYSYVVDADREEYGVTDPRLEMWWWEVKRRTPKGAWLWTGEFVLLTAFKKKYAETEALAIRDFKARKNKQIQILSRQLANAERELALTKPRELLIA
ncbi:hypothetical protein QA639_21160 [Bradyrhizobium pachyrhizi]|uniref:hypothetical protein n=1 Tax=Bradyrhizobium pachyrhizi TaxID=280333 RepID=UPI0024B12CB9|nr:hypothetical protein [Bradyrhizobium pachyrhizi]WFU52219.1 hypothetical protein QA639_21160 [Bradyrhizobium pachyrhizi]